MEPVRDIWIPSYFGPYKNKKDCEGTIWRAIEGSSNTTQKAPHDDEFYASTWLGSGAHLFGQGVAVKIGAPGWLSRLSIRILISAQAVISWLWDRAPHQALHWAWSLLGILSPSPSAPPSVCSCVCASALSLNKKINLKNKRCSLEGIYGCD